MIVIRDPTAVSSITQLEPYPDIRHLVEQRFVQILDGEPYSHELHGYMLVVEPGDTVAGIEQESGCPILHSFFGDARFGDPEFAPCCEALEEHAACFEMLFILNDDGFGIEIFIPKVVGMDAELLAMCAQYAVPAPDLAEA